jgi:hypothetical protein
VGGRETKGKSKTTLLMKTTWDESVKRFGDEAGFH